MYITWSPSCIVESKHSETYLQEHKWYLLWAELCSFKVCVCSNPRTSECEYIWRWGLWKTCLGINYNLLFHGCSCTRSCHPSYFFRKCEVENFTKQEHQGGFFKTLLLYIFKTTNVPFSISSWPRLLWWLLAGVLIYGSLYTNIPHKRSSDQP